MKTWLKSRTLSLACGREVGSHGERRRRADDLQPKAGAGAVGDHNQWGGGGAMRGRDWAGAGSGAAERATYAAESPRTPHSSDIGVISAAANKPAVAPAGVQWVRC